MSILSWVAGFISRVRCLWKFRVFNHYQKGEQNIIFSWPFLHLQYPRHAYLTTKASIRLYLSPPCHNNSGTLVSRRSGSGCHRSPRTRTVGTPLSEGGSTRAEHSLNRPLRTWAPGSALLLKLGVRWVKKRGEKVTIKQLKLSYKLTCCRLISLFSDVGYLTWMSNHQLSCCMLFIYYHFFWCKIKV